MVALTNSQFLPYQTSGDNRCDAPAVWKALAERVDGLVGDLGRSAARLYPTVPIAVLRTSQQVVRVPTDPAYHVPFDTVYMDTDSMVDLDLDPTTVTPRRKGRYHATARARLGASGTPAATERLYFLLYGGAGSATGDGQQQDSAAPSMGHLDAGVLYLHDVQAAIHADWDVAGANAAANPVRGFSVRIPSPVFADITVYQVDLAVFWVNDL